MGDFTTHPSLLDRYRAPELRGFVRQHRTAGTAPVSLIWLEQPGGEYRSPGLSELAVYFSLSPHEGRYDLGRGGTASAAEAGEFAVVAPGTPTCVRIDHPHSILAAAIPGVAVERWLSDLRMSHFPFDFGFLHHGGGRSELVDLLLRRLWDASSGPPAARLLADSLMYALLAELVRVANGRAPPAPRGGLAPWQVSLVTDYMREHLAEPIGLGTLARLTGLSVHHFCRSFRATAGVPAHALLRRIRLDRARELLSLGEPVSRVVEAVGFSDTAYFSRAYRRAFGTTPSASRPRRAG